MDRFEKDQLKIEIRLDLEKELEQITAKFISDETERIKRGIKPWDKWSSDYDFIMEELIGNSVLVYLIERFGLNPLNALELFGFGNIHLSLPDRSRVIAIGTNNYLNLPTAKDIESLYTFIQADFYNPNTIIQTEEVIKAKGIEDIDALFCIPRGPFGLVFERLMEKYKNNQEIVFKVIGIYFLEKLEEYIKLLSPIGVAFIQIPIYFAWFNSSFVRYLVRRLKHLGFNLELTRNRKYALITRAYLEKSINEA